MVFANITDESSFGAAAGSLELEKERKFQAEQRIIATLKEERGRENLRLFSSVL